MPDNEADITIAAPEQPLPEDDGPGEEDGPWADGFEERFGIGKS